MPADTLSVARDAYLEADDLAAVLDLARTMALERLARGLPVAWVSRTLGGSQDYRVIAAFHDGAWRVTRRVVAGVSTWPVDADIVDYNLSTAVAILDPDALRAEWGV